jgi:hypothetical protein
VLGAPPTPVGEPRGIGDGMLIYLTFFVIILLTLRLGFYTLRKMSPSSFKLDTSVWRLFSLRMEIQSGPAQDHRATRAKDEGQAER